MNKWIGRLIIVQDNHNFITTAKSVDTKASRREMEKEPALLQLSTLQWQYQTLKRYVPVRSIHRRGASATAHWRMVLV